MTGFRKRQAKNESPHPQTTRDPMMVAYWERVLNGLVYELYFPDELHAAGLRLFDLVAQIGLPKLPHAKARSREEENERSETHASDSLRASASPRETHSSPQPLRAFASSRETTFLPTLRAKFEELADAAHPLRRALDKLATLETIRIIEGKA